MIDETYCYDAAYLPKKLYFDKTFCYFGKPPCQLAPPSPITSRSGSATAMWHGDGAVSPLVSSITPKSVPTYSGTYIWISRGFKIAIWCIHIAHRNWYLRKSYNFYTNEKVKKLSMTTESCAIIHLKLLWSIPFLLWRKYDLCIGTKPMEISHWDDSTRRVLDSPKSSKQTTARR